MDTLRPEYETPGQLIKALLQERGWSQTVAALVLGIDQSTISGIISEKKRIDASLALRLADVFEMSADAFLDLQKAHDLRQASLVEQPDPRRAIRANLFGRLPIAEMITRGWLSADSIKEVGKVEESLAKFFGAGSPDEIEILPHAAKKTQVSEDVTPSQLAWIYRARHMASELVVPRYSPALVREAISKMSDLRLSPIEIRQAPRILAESGVRFVIVESLSNTKIDGACFWLNDMAPCVAMTLRFDRIDNFWFVLRHELEHVLRGHGRTVIALDVDLEGERAGTGAAVMEQERVANQAAADFCVARESMDAYYDRKAPIFTDRDVMALATMLKIHPGLVAGQLQHRTGQYNRFRKHLVKVRSIVAPSAAVDGWGDVFPVSA